MQEPKSNGNRSYPIDLPDVPADAPTFGGTEVPVEYLYTYWDRRFALKSFLMDFPEVGSSQALAALRKRAEAEAPADSQDGLMGGMPVFRGTRVPVEYLFNQLKHGGNIDEFISQYTTVKREDVVRALEAASEFVEVAAYAKSAG